MILRIKIDDDTYETYGAYNKKDPRKEPGDFQSA